MSNGQAEVLVYLANSFPFKYETVVIKERQTANALKFAVCKKQGITTRFDDYSIYWLHNNTKVKELPEKPYALHVKWGEKSGAKNKFLFLNVEKQQDFKKTLKAARIEQSTERGDPIGDTIKFLTAHALEEVGLFRVSGSQRRIREIVTLYEQGGTVTPDMYGGTHNAAGILKLWLREQDILIPPDFTQRLNDIGTNESDEEKCADGISEVFKTISKERIANLHKLCLFLEKLAQGSAINKMDAGNLSIIFCPIFDISAPVFTTMINQLSRIFTPLISSSPAEPKQTTTINTRTPSIDASPALRTAAETARIMNEAPAKAPPFKPAPFNAPPKVPPKSARPVNTFPKRSFVPQVQQRQQQQKPAPLKAINPRTFTDNASVASEESDTDTDPFQMIEGLQSEFAELEAHIANITFDDGDDELDDVVDTAIEENLFTSVDDLVSTPFSLPSKPVASRRPLAASEPIPDTPDGASRKALSSSAAEPYTGARALPRTPKAARPKSFSAFKKLPPKKFGTGRGKFRIQGKGKFGVRGKFGGRGKGRGRGRGNFGPKRAPFR